MARRRIRRRIVKDPKLVRLYFNRTLVSNMFDTSIYVIFSRNKNLPAELKNQFEFTGLPGPIFKKVLPNSLSKLASGTLYMLGTNSNEALQNYLKSPINSAIMIKWTINTKNYIMTVFDFNRILKLQEKYDSNVQRYSFFY